MSTPTPRTDAAKWEIKERGNTIPIEVVAASFARKLERDISTLNDRLIDRQQTLMSQAIEIQSLKTQLAALRRSSSATLTFLLTNQL